MSKVQKSKEQEYWEDSIFSDEEINYISNLSSKTINEKKRFILTELIDACYACDESEYIEGPDEILSLYDVKGFFIHGFAFIDKNKKKDISYIPYIPTFLKGYEEEWDSQVFLKIFMIFHKFPKNVNGNIDFAIFFDKYINTDNVNQTILYIYFEFVLNRFKERYVNSQTEVGKKRYKKIMSQVDKIKNPTVKKAIKDEIELLEDSNDFFQFL